jgi:hypothetical protein
LMCVYGASHSFTQPLRLSTFTQSPAHARACTCTQSPTRQQFGTPAHAFHTPNRTKYPLFGNIPALDAIAACTCGTSSMVHSAALTRHPPPSLCPIICLGSPPPKQTHQHAPALNAIAACTCGTNMIVHSAEVAAQRTEGTTLRVWGATKFAISPAAHSSTHVRQWRRAFAVAPPNMHTYTYMMYLRTALVYHPPVVTTPPPPPHTHTILILVSVFNRHPSCVLAFISSCSRSGGRCVEAPLAPSHMCVVKGLLELPPSTCLSPRTLPSNITSTPFPYRHERTHNGHRLFQGWHPRGPPSSGGTRGGPHVKCTLWQPRHRRGPPSGCMPPPPPPAHSPLSSSCSRWSGGRCGKKRSANT